MTKDLQVMHHSIYVTWQLCWRRECRISQVFSPILMMYQYRCAEIDRFYRGRCCNSLQRLDFVEKNLEKEAWWFVCFQFWLFLLYPHWCGFFIQVAKSVIWENTFFSSVFALWKQLMDVSSSAVETCSICQSLKNLYLLPLFAFSLEQTQSFYGLDANLLFKSSKYQTPNYYH